MPLSRLDRARRGFGLIELLIAITVVATLAALLTYSIGQWRGRALAASLQGTTSRILEAQSAYFQAEGRFAGTLAELNLDRVLPAEARLAGMAVRDNLLHVALTHPAGVACVGTMTATGRRVQPGAMACDTKMGLGIVASVLGNDVSVDATAAYAAGLLAHVWGPAAAWAAPIDEVEWVFWSFEPGAAVHGDPTTTTTTTYSYTSANATRDIHLVILYKSGRVRGGRYATTITGTGNNQAPTARIALGTSTLGTGGILRVDGRASFDVDGTIASYSWDFGTGGPAVTGPLADTRYLAPGPYTVTLTVTDNLGATGTASRVVTVSGIPVANITPTAQFRATPAPAVVGQAIILDASDALDADGRIVDYAWSITGIGPTVTPTGVTASFTPPSTGTASIRLIVTDDQGAADTLTQSVVVTLANLAPTLSIAPGTASVREGDLLSLSAASAADPEGGSLRVRWEFDDGNTAEGTVVSHRWSRAGTFTVRATATDSLGATATATATITVTANLPPVISGFSSAPLPTALGTPTNFTALGVGDPDGNIRQIRWLFSDGTYLLGPTPVHTFLTPGLQTISVTVQDDNGAETTFSDTLRVGSPPTAAFSVDVSPIIPGELVSLDGSASSSPTGIGAMVWYLGDGTKDSTLSPTRTHTYASILAGRQATISLVVYNSDFSMADTAVVVVPMNTRPTATITPTGVVGFGVAVPFSAGAADADGDPLTYAWDFGGDGSSTLAGPSHTFSASGPYTVAVVVTDSMSSTTALPITASITVADRPTVTLDVVADSGYPTQPLSMVAVGTADAANSATIARYLWELGDGRIDSTGSGTRSVSYAAPGTYIVSVRARDSYGSLSLPAVDTVVISAGPQASFTVSPGTTDSTLTPFVMTSTTSGPTGYHLQWAIDGFELPADTLPSFTRSFPVRGTYVVRLIASYGPVADTATATLTVLNRPPTASFEVTPLLPDSSAQMSTVLTALATASDPDGGYLDYHWSINGVPQAGYRGRSMQWAPGRPDTLVVSLWVFDRQGDSTFGGTQTVYITDIPLTVATVTPVPNGIVAPGASAGFLVSHRLRPSRTHTYAWTAISYAGATPDTTFSTGSSPYLSVTTANGDSLVGYVTITDDLGAILTPPPGVLRARHLPTSTGFACTPDDAPTVATIVTCEFSSPQVGETGDSMVAEGNPIDQVAPTGMRRVLRWSKPGTYSVRTYYRAAPTPGGLQGAALTANATVTVRSQGITGVDFTVNGNTNAAADSSEGAMFPRTFAATGTDLEGGPLSYVWYVNNDPTPWSTDSTWRVSFARTGAPWNITMGNAYANNTVRLIAFNTLGDSTVVTKTVKWAECNLTNGARVRPGLVSTGTSPVGGPRPLLSVTRWWCGANITGIDNQLFVRAVRDGVPENWIRWNQLRAGSSIPLDSAVAAGSYSYAVQYYLVGHPDTLTAPGLIPVEFYTGAIPGNTAPYITEFTPTSNVLTAPYTVATHSNATGSGTSHPWRIRVRDPEGGLLTVRWYLNEALVNTQASNRAPNAEWAPTYTINLNAMPAPYRDTYYSLRAEVSDPGGLIAVSQIDTVRVGRVTRAININQVSVSPTPDTLPGTPTGLARFAFSPNVAYTFSVAGTMSNPGGRIDWAFPDGTTASVPVGTDVVKTFTRAVAPEETHTWNRSIGRLAVSFSDSASRWAEGTLGPNTAIRYQPVALGGPDSTVTGNNAGLSFPARVLSTPPVVRIAFPLNPDGSADTTVILGDTLAVAADVYDPDNEPVTLAWFLDDSLVSTGTTWAWEAEGRTGRRFLRLRAEDASGVVSEVVRTPVVLDESLFARLSINATYVRQSETGDTAFYVAPIGTSITLDPDGSVVPAGLAGAIRHRMWSGDGAPPPFSPGLPSPTVAGYPVGGGLFYPGLTLLTENGSIGRSNPIALCLLGVPSAVTLARNLPYTFLGRRIRQVELLWTSGACGGDETRIYRQTTDGGARTLDATIPSSQVRLLRDYPMDGAPDSLYLSAQHVGGPLLGAYSSAVGLEWGLGAAPADTIMPPVAEAEHDGRLFAAMPMGIAVNRPDSTIVFSSISANATSTVFSVNGGPWTPGTTATLTGCAPITAVTSFTIRTMRIRVTNPAGSSERQWRIACGTNPVIGSPPTASTDVIGSLPWFRGDSLFANSTSTDPEGGLATTQWQVREAPDASEWVNLSLTDTAVSFLATGNTLQLSYFGGTTPNLRMVPGTHFPQGFELRLLVVDADEQIDTTAAISAPYLGNRAPTASLVRSPSGGVRTLTNVTFTAVCTDPEGDTPFTYAWSPTNRTSGDGGVSAIYRMDDNGVTVVDMTCTDLYGASASASLSLTWNNRGPNRGSFSVSPASPFALGETITITASGYSDPDGTVTEWQWELREPDNILRTLSNGTPSINWTLLSGMDGNVLIRYRARDDDGAWSGWSGNSTYIMGDPNATPINNGITSPVANGFNVSIGSLDVFSGACTDLDGDPLTYRWRVNGVTVDSSSVPSYNHTWNTNGAATITFDCWDGRDWSAAATRTGTVNNAAPTATLLVPADGFYALPSSSLAVSASGTDPDGHAITSYRWYVNGSLVSTTATSTTTLTMPAGNGAVTIGVSVGDPYGLWSTIVTVNGIVTNIVGPGSIVAAQDAVLAGNSMTFTASGFAGATSYSWLVNGAAAGTGTSISPVLTEGLYTIEVSATNGLDTQTATLSNYCALGIPATQAPAQPYDDTNNSAGQTWWTLTGGSKRPRWTNPVCHDATISVVVRTRVGAGAWGAYTPYGTTTGNNYTHPGNLSAREPVGIGAPNRFYQFAIILTAGSGAASTGPVEDPSWVTIP